MENNLNHTPTENQTEETSFPKDRTSVCSHIVLAPEQLPHLMEKSKNIAAQEIAAEISDLFLGLEAKLGNQRFVKMENKRVWCDREVSGLYPRLDIWELPQFDTKYTNAAKYPGMDCEGFHFDTMTVRECRTTFAAGNGNPFLAPDGSCKYFAVKGRSLKNCNMFLTRETRNGMSHVITSDGGNSLWVCDSTRVTLVPIHRLKCVNGGPMSFGEALAFWLGKGLIPEGLSGAQKKVYTQLMEALPSLGKYCTLAPEIPVFQSERFLKDVKSGKMQDFVFSYDFNDTHCAEEVLSGKKNLSTALDGIRKELLNCDKKRANLEPYDAKRLTDLNLGHWDLCEDAKNGGLQFDMPKNQYFVARPPQMDVMTNAVCAIDFGTKSTVVACRDQDERLLRVGAGDYARAAELEDYENPTVIELCDIKSFMEAYRAREGRPFTEWEQMTVSHQAADSLKQTKHSKVYYSVFSELKQWANNKEHRMMMRDRKGCLVELKPYAELQEGDFDPIELYAYYLGLYINNMHRRIYLDYILSFPVTYSTEVRERIRQSFERGIRKSLPMALLKDEEMMKHFRVYAGASEPAAYAISALQEFGLEPKEDGEKVSYAVFDFGGGTTDYDFGVEYIPKDHRRNFVIEQLGRGGGDPHLGGENILALLAYEVYKDNIAEMRAKKIPFVIPAKGRAVAGAETLIKDVKEASQQAHMNSKWLSEILRDIWEQKPGYEKKFEEQGKKTIPLCSSDSTEESDTVNVDIVVNLEHLKKCIEETIRAGVADFFTEMMHAFNKLESDQIHIFLAGNSCKSPVVKQLFEEYMGRYEKKIANDIRRAKSKDKKTEGVFVLHLPLGMKDTSKVPDDDKDADVRPDTGEQLDLDKVRTGKTGVVFGLLRSRKGGRDVKIKELDLAEQKEIIFPYYLGDIDRSNHFHVRIGRDVSYGKWAQFLPADEAEFELYYTKEARSLENTMSPQEVTWVHCLIDENEVHEDKHIYICKASPDTIKYAVGDAKTNFDEGFKGKIYTQSLR